MVVFFFGLIGTLAGHRKNFMRFSVGLGPVWLLLFWAGFSLLWSVNPGVTFWGLLELAATTGFGMLFSFYYRIEEQLKILFLYVLTGVFLSLLLILFFPSQGISSGAHEGAWKGVFWHKNILGIHAAFGIVLLVLCGAEETRYRGVYWVGLVACLILLVGSRSLTAAASAFAGVATYAAVMSLRNPPWGLKRGYVAMAWVIGVVFCFLCIFLFFIGHLDFVLQLLGRDPTLGTRTDLWSILLDMGAHRPWLGHGFRSFWTGSVGLSGEVERKLGHYPFHAHNGVVDLFLDLGIVGVVIFTVCLIRASIPAYRTAIENHRKLDSWHMLFLVFLIVCNLTESRLVEHNCVFLMLFVTGTCNLFGRSDIRLLEKLPGVKRS